MELLLDNPLPIDLMVDFGRVGDSALLRTEDRLWAESTLLSEGVEVEANAVLGNLLGRGLVVDV